MDDIKKGIGAHIKQLRENHKETQKELAEAIQVSKDTISKIEQGSVNLTIENAIKIAKHYDKVSIDWICGLSEDVGGSNKTLDLLLSYITFTKSRKVFWGDSNDGDKTHWFPAAFIDSRLSQLLTDLKRESELRNDNVPTDVIEEWIKAKKKLFTDAIQDKEKNEQTEYAIIEYEKLPEDIAEKIEQLYYG